MYIQSQRSQRIILTTLLTMTSFASFPGALLRVTVISAVFPGSIVPNTGFTLKNKKHQLKKMKILTGKQDYQKS